MSENGEGKVVAAESGGEVGGEGRTVEQERDELANALSFEKEKNKILLGEVVVLEDDFADRCLEQYDAVLSNESREFWREQLLSNREQASAALADLARAVAVGGGGEKPGVVRRPLHNRAVSRPVAPVEVGGGGRPVGSDPVAVGSAGGADRAAKLRNRAHEISAAERIPFQTAFRRAEREMGGQ